MSRYLKGFRNVLISVSLGVVIVINPASFVKDVGKVSSTTTIDLKVQYQR